MATDREPIVFISRHRVIPGKLPALRAFMGAGIAHLEATKPRTSAFLSYLDADGSHLTIVHVFADAAGLALHIEGANQRSDAASEFIEPESREILGSPTGDVLAAIQPPPASGIAFNLQPIFAGGFLRGSA